ncbi:helix-turn-helix domain-containing protein [Roseateles sp. P5_E11]
MVHISQKKITLNLNQGQQAHLEAIGLRLRRSRRWVTAALVRRGLGQQHAADPQIFQGSFDRQLREAVAAVAAMVPVAAGEVGVKGGVPRGFAAVLTDVECDVIKSMADEQERSSAWMAARLIARGLQDLGLAGAAESQADFQAMKGIVESPMPIHPGARSVNDAVHAAGPAEAQAAPGDTQPAERSPHPVVTLLAQNVHLAMLLKWGKASYTRLAAASGLGTGTLHRIKVGEGAASIDTLAKLAGALGLDVWRLLAPRLGADIAEVARTLSEDAVRVAEAVDAVADPQVRRGRADAILQLMPQG